MRHISHKRRNSIATAIGAADSRCWKYCWCWRCLLPSRRWQFQPLPEFFPASSCEARGTWCAARFSEARVRAIKTGDVYGFFYQPGSGQYWVAPMVTGFRSLATGTMPPSRQYVLENEIVFSAGETANDSRSDDAQANVNESGMKLAQFRPILFYPDGTTQNATIQLQTKNGLRIQVDLRGLTGSATRSGLLTGRQEEQAK